MKRIRVGDAEAFEALFERHKTAVYQYLLRTLRDRNATEDLTQEVFLRVWTRAEQWNGRGAFKGWLYRIATNLALNYLRSVRRRREQPLDLPADPEGEDALAPVPGWMIDASMPGPEDALQQAEQERSLRRMIDALPDEKREVFRLIHDAEMEVREVAETLGIPAGTVKSRLHYARKLLAHDWESLLMERETEE
jgi:RNA polymerase sigma-70 factor (ECF subfamily)